MSGHHHDDHHSAEQKPVAFTVPFLLALTVIIAVVMFLSLCDPKPHHADMEGHGHGQVHGEASKPVNHEAAVTGHHEEPAAEAAKDSAAAEPAADAAEPAHH